jgi:hypothetical protein
LSRWRPTRNIQKAAARWEIRSEILGRKLVVRYPQPLPVGNELDGTVLICAINSVPAEPVDQSLQYLRTGMTKGVICSNANHREFRVDRRQKVLGSGCVAAMMGDLGD